MSFDSPADTLQTLAIEARGVGKRFSLFSQSSDRLKQLLWGRYKQYSRDFWALQDVSFDIRRGEVVGLVGRNGAGKSTLLQMVCGTLTPTHGTLAVRGRVAALLELGAGFSPDFSGLENVYMNAAILGMGRAQVDERLDSILAFADIGQFIHQPVKTYSSGMFVRLAFAVATSVDPDILVIDEALSVGDGAFARKSFDRIMDMKDRGATILFCSHSMYHVQALCSRALWLEGGRMRMWDEAPKVTAAYETSLVMEDAPLREGDARPAHADAATNAMADSFEADSLAHGAKVRKAPDGTAVITDIQALADGVAGRELAIHSGRTTLELRVQFDSDPALPCPSVAIGIAHANGTVVASAGSANDGVELSRDAVGSGIGTLTLPKLPLLQGDYTISVILACERGLHPYEIVERAITLRVVQTGLEQGLVSLPRQWTAKVAA
ncbi:ABC-type polysaccharide/polyol phosphate transport system, ATPase component [Acidovorax sp. CF316]|uniref:ABC transporter ATP-binding protein n=1 Tax=Acidovorax sp. CF316 TaxID=1144317 RepID=UPI00026BD328|nr:ABC transporter ATP-binding protein [Acidovorax sp. CF316]EJE53626.1 ABC-type polysaccharide/polyol phosphate transport system, ATPase component [Acidovorax sp. CF316]